MTSGERLRKYTLLEALLAQKGLPLKGIYTTKDVAKIFGVSVRAIQERVRSGQIASRDLPGRARFLSEDLETFLQNSTKKAQVDPR